MGTSCLGERQDCGFRIWAGASDPGQGVSAFRGVLVALTYNCPYHLLAYCTVQYIQEEAAVGKARKGRAVVIGPMNDSGNRSWKKRD